MRGDRDSGNGQKYIIASERELITQAPPNSFRHSHIHARACDLRKSHYFFISLLDFKPAAC